MIRSISRMHGTRAPNAVGEPQGVWPTELAIVVLTTPYLPADGVRAVHRKARIQPYFACQIRDIRAGQAGDEIALMEKMELWPKYG